MHRYNGSISVARYLTICSAMVWLACSGGSEASQETSPLTPSAQAQDVKADALRIDVSRSAIAYDYANLNHLIHGPAGDERFVFIAHPLSAKVAVLDRFTGAELGSLPAPPDGWLLPFSIRVPNSGRVVVLDPGGFPSPTLIATPRLYEYDYSWNRRTKTFSATLVRTISFAGLPLVFTEDFDVMPNGGYVVSESIIGALWNVAPDGSITPGLLPASFNPADAIAALGPCEFTPITIGDVPFTSAGNFAPGVGALANRNGLLYFGSSCTGGISRIPIGSLTDPTRSPSQRAADIVPVTTRAPDVVEETLHGLAFNRWDAKDDRLYACDSFARRIVRINTTTGAREVLSDDTNLFDFPIGLQFLPPVDGVTPLVVASDQEYRLAALNPLISADLFHPPWVVAKVYILK